MDRTNGVALGNKSQRSLSYTGRAKTCFLPCEITRFLQRVAHKLVAVDLFFICVSQIGFEAVLNAKHKLTNSLLESTTMKTIKFFLLALILGTVATQSVQAQMDPLEYVQRLEQQFGMQAEMYARQAVEAYREETGDYDTPDLQVWNHVDAMARQQNPGFYQNLQARENAFMQQQQAYHQNSMAILDGLQSSYMNRSNSDYQSHQDYIREGIWNRA